MQREECGCKSCEMHGYECVQKIKEGKAVFYFEEQTAGQTMTQKVKVMSSPGK